MKINEVIGVNFNIRSFIERLTPDCHLWFSLFGGWQNALINMPLWRGIHANYDSIATVIPCPVNRKPTLTSNSLHFCADAWFLRNTGYRFRSNAFFCDFDKEVAASYGRPYIFVPIGEFKYCWSPAYHDMTLSMERNSSRAISNQPIHNVEQWVNLFLNEGDYIMNNIHGARIEGSEIMVHCNEAYFIDPLLLEDIM